MEKVSVHDVPVAVLVGRHVNGISRSIGESPGINLLVCPKLTDLSSKKNDVACDIYVCTRGEPHALLGVLELRQSLAVFRCESLNNLSRRSQDAGVGSEVTACS